MQAPETLLKMYFFFKKALPVQYFQLLSHFSLSLLTAENKPIWMHAEEREEMSKVGSLRRLLLLGFLFLLLHFSIQWLICKAADVHICLLHSVICSVFILGQTQRQHPVWRVWGLVQSL